MAAANVSVLLSLSTRTALPDTIHLFGPGEVRLTNDPDRWWPAHEQETTFALPFTSDASCLLRAEYRDGMHIVEGNERIPMGGFDRGGGYRSLWPGNEIASGGGLRVEVLGGVTGRVEATLTLSTSDYPVPPPPSPEQIVVLRTTTEFPPDEDLWLQPFWTWLAYAHNPSCPEPLLAKFGMVPLCALQRAVASNPSTPVPTLAMLSKSYSLTIVDNAVLPFIALEDPGLSQFSPPLRLLWRQRQAGER